MALYVWRFSPRSRQIFDTSIGSAWGFYFRGATDPWASETKVLQLGPGNYSR